MLKQIEIRSTASAPTLARVIGSLGSAFPDLKVETRRQAPSIHAVEIAVTAPAVVVVPAAAWRAPAFDPLELDAAVARTSAPDFSLRLLDEVDGRGDLLETAVQIVTRCQRHLGGRNGHSAAPLFDAILARHRALHPLDKPLVAADYDHALDTWRWVLRLDGEASMALQVAALFHDVERLVSESDTRVEQHAADYPAFKRAHAAAGARMAAAVIAMVGAPGALVTRVAELVATHESSDGDREKALLNEADALSFFSLNAPGFLRYYGPEHTAKKVAYTAARLGPRGRRALAGIRHRADIAAMLARALRPAGEKLAG
jgi:hypothetical protein